MLPHRRWRRVPGLDPQALLAALALLSTGGLPAQAHDPLRTLRAMQIEGCAAFDRDQVATVLAADAETVRALQREPDAAAAAQVAERIGELHRRAGYLDAKAGASVEAGVLHVELQAGTRYRCGRVLCAGSAALSDAQLGGALAATGSDRATWAEGEFPRNAPERLVAQATQRVLAAYRAVGRHGAKVTIETAIEADQVLLRIHVHDEGHEVRVQSLAVHGEDGSAAAATLAAVEFAPGALLTPEWQQRLRGDVEALGRHLRVGFEVPDPVPAVLDPLVIRVEPLSNAPAVGAFELRDLRHLRRAIHRAVDDLRAGRVLEASSALTEPVRWHGISVLPGRVAARLGRAGLALEAEAVQWGSGAPVRSILRVTGDGLVVEVGEHVARCAFGTDSAVSVRLTSTVDAAGEVEMRWGIGLERKGQSRLDASLHQGLAAKLLATADGIRRHGEELELDFDGTRVRLAADGSLSGPGIELPWDDRRVLVHWAEEPIAGRPVPAAAPDAAADPAAHPVVAWLRLLDQVFAPRGDGPTRGTTRRDLILGAIAAATRQEARLPDDEVVPPAELPALRDTAPTLPGAVAAVLGRLAVDRDVDPGIAALAAAFAAVARGDAAAGDHFQRLTASGEVGPLLLALAARAFGLVGLEHAAEDFRTLAAERWSFAACWEDVARLGDSLPLLRGLTTRIGAEWRRRDGLAELFVDLPPGATGDAMAWRRGMEAAWDDGLGEGLRAVLTGR